MSTDGISIEPWPPFYVMVPDGDTGKTKRQEVELTLWDFAGQEIYYATYVIDVYFEIILEILW
jgi:hypothetical protein